PGGPQLVGQQPVALDDGGRVDRPAVEMQDASEHGTLVVGPVAWFGGDRGRPALRWARCQFATVETSQRGSLPITRSGAGTLLPLRNLWNVRLDIWVRSRMSAVTT